MNSPPLTVTAPQLRPPFGYLAIEGPIGVGKTSLARRLAQRWSMQELFERPQDNPFLERFYRDTARYALPTQLHFALQRAQQAQEVQRGTRGGHAADRRFHDAEERHLRASDAAGRRVAACIARSPRAST